MRKIKSRGENNQMEQDIFRKLFIFEMANNHSGDVDQGLHIIKEMGAVSRKYDFNFGFKFQYRDLDTFIHPDYIGREDIKYVKRFSETRISEDDFRTMLKEVRAQGFTSICTPI